VSNIEWTDRTWNPVTGCTKVSAGCKHCYAEGVAHRFWHTLYDEIPTGRHDASGSGPETRPRLFTDVQTHEDKLLAPLSWRKPSRVFVNSMSDLFHEDVPDEFIDRVFAVMALASRHTFQVLTKRPERMREYLCRNSTIENIYSLACRQDETLADRWDWPLPNVWLGVSVEDQATADARISLLLQTPAAVRFISAEPLLGPVDVGPWLYVPTRCRACGHGSAYYDTNPTGSQAPFGKCAFGVPMTGEHGGLRCSACDSPDCEAMAPLSWVIVGGESGSKARPCDVAWIRSIVRQCQSAGVPVFVKQLGSKWNLGGFTIHGRLLVDRKGADPAEWPEDLRVRQFPEAL
jgi:protein gp37